MTVKRSSAGQIAVRGKILDSPAFLSLTGSAIKVYFQILKRRQWGRVGPKKKWTCLNAGKIEFPYRQAEKLGIKLTTFTRAIDQLVEKGLIDIVANGGMGRPTLFGESERWKQYGTPNFDEAKREKDYREIGFRKCRKE